MNRFAEKLSRHGLNLRRARLQTLQLRQRFGVEFTRLFRITNQPIARFAEDLRAHGQWDAYLESLATSFNPSTVDGLMCRSTISIGCFRNALTLTRTTGAIGWHRRVTRRPCRARRPNVWGDRGSDALPG